MYFVASKLHIALTGIKAILQIVHTVHIATDANKTNLSFIVLSLPRRYTYWTMELNDRLISLLRSSFPRTAWCKRRLLAELSLQLSEEHLHKTLISIIVSRLKMQ